jgi:hypothetical protein
VKALSRASSLFLWVPLLLAMVAMLGVLLSFLYVVLLGGPWTLFQWTGGAFLALIIVVKLASLSLDYERQTLVSAMLWEYFGGMTGWAWMILALASFVLFIRALFLDGSWRAFLTCFIASAACKLLTRVSSGWKEGAMFKRALAQQGIGKEQARRAWIAEAQKRLTGRGQSTSR